MFKKIIISVMIFLSCHSIALAEDNFYKISKALQQISYNNHQVEKAFYKKDYTSDFDAYLKKAKAGDAAAQFHIANMYQRSKTLEYNLVESAKWFAAAAKNGHGNAAMQLGKMHESGYGVEKSVQKAFDNFLLGAKLGDAEAQFWTGYYYTTGSAGEESPVEAAKWYKQSASQGYQTSMIALGELYLNGLGVERDIDKAIDWHLKHAGEGNIQTFQDIGIIYYRLFKKEKSEDYGLQAYYYFKIHKKLVEHAKNKFSMQNSVSLMESLEEKLPAKSIKIQDTMVETWAKTSAKLL